MGINNKYLTAVMLGIVGLTLSGCAGHDQKVANYNKRTNYDILNTYDYDIANPIARKKLTVRQLANNLLLTETGIETNQKTYKKVGIDKDDGVFVKSAITDGDGVVEISALQNDLGDKSSSFAEYAKRKNEENYASVMADRTKVLEDNLGELGSDNDRLVNELAKSVSKQQKLDQKNKLKKVKDDKSVGVELSK